MKQLEEVLEVLVKLRKKQEDFVKRLEEFQTNMDYLEEFFNSINEKQYKLIELITHSFNEKLNILVNCVQASLLSQMFIIGSILFYCLLNSQINNPFGTVWWFLSLIATLFGLTHLDSLKQLEKQEIKKVFTKEEFLKAVEKAKPRQEIFFDERWEQLDE